VNQVGGFQAIIVPAKSQVSPRLLSPPCLRPEVTLSAVWPAPGVPIELARKVTIFWKQS